MSTNLETIFSQTLQSKLQDNKTLDLRKVAKKASTEEVRKEIESLADEFGGNLTANNIIPFTKKIKSIGGDTQQLDITKGDTSDTEATKLESAVIKTFVKKEDKSELTQADLVNPNLKLVTSPDIENDMVSTIPSLSIKINPSQQTQQSTGTSSASKTVDLTFSPDEQRSLITLAKSVIDKASQCTDPAEIEKIVSNFLTVLDQRFVLFNTYSSFHALLPNYSDSPILQTVVASITMAASNYVGKVISTAPKDDALQAGDRLRNSSLSLLKDFLRGETSAKFKLEDFKKAVREKKESSHPKLISKILESKENTTVKEVIDLIREYAFTLSLQDRNNLLSSLGLGLDDLMVNYALTRISKVLNERVSAIDAGQQGVRKAFSELVASTYKLG